MSLVDRLTRRLSLRARIFLFFAAAAIACICLVGLIDYAAFQAASPENGTFILRAGVASAFGILAVLVAVWLQFDAHIARPIERMSRFARSAAHSADLSDAALPDARYLGYLAPAVMDLSRALRTTREQQAEAVRAATQRAERQKARLAAILHDLDDGVLICNREHEILLYNRSAVDILADVGAIGLRRSVFEVLAPEPVRHNLARLEKRLREGRHLTHEDGLSLPFAALCVDGRTTIEAVMTLTLVPDSPEPQGYILTFSDETELLAASAEAERRMVALAERMRGHAGALHLLGEMLIAAEHLPDQARALAASIAEEVGLLAASSDELDALAMDELSRTWPMGPVLAETLFALVLERGRLKAPPVTRARRETGILCDSAAMAALIARLCEWVEKRGGRTIVLKAEIDPIEGGFLDIIWQGEPIAIRSIDRWLRSALDYDLGPVTAADVLARHASDIWSEAVPGDTAAARLRIPLQMRDLSRLPVIPPRLHERAPVYDFDIFDEALPQDLAETPLDRLTVVVFDTETTGLEPSRGDRMVSIAGVRIVNARLLETESFDCLVNPGRAIPPRSTAVHRITDAMVAEAEPAPAVAERFARFARNAVLVAHNAPFDMRFLTMAAAETGLEIHNPVLDTVLLAAHLHGAGEDLTLDRLAEIYGVELSAEARHTAHGDALATAKIFLALLAPLRAAGITTLGEAVRASEAQVALRRRQAAYE